MQTAYAEETTSETETMDEGTASEGLDEDAASEAVDEGAVSEEDLVGALFPASEDTYVSTSIHLSKTSVRIALGKSVKLKLVKAKAGKVKWTVKNKRIATVKAGKVRAKKPGTAVVTAKYNRIYQI